MPCRRPSRAARSPSGSLSMQRRDFLRTLALGGAAILAGGSALGANAQPAPPGGYPAPGGRPPPPPPVGERPDR
ncbi:twin-arginine translocation signal domain-containing protein, partial [Burkholderia gladioli]|uniref:twin-arginine translocation signal domain-containing protein n=1 Tax=Burkholderia gladioli TaxID=28095 RepID=UPI00345E7C86